MFDPTKVLYESGEPVKKLIAHCTSKAVNDTFPGWKWAPYNVDTGLKEQEYQPWDTPIPMCGESYRLFLLLYTLTCYMLLSKL